MLNFGHSDAHGYPPLEDVMTGVLTAMLRSTGATAHSLYTRPIGATHVITEQQSGQQRRRTALDADPATSCGISLSRRGHWFSDPTRNLSQLSHGLTGRYRTMTSLPDTGQDADLPIRIPAHGSDGLH